MKEWEVPYRVVYRGTAVVEAETAEEAEAIVDRGDFEEFDGSRFDYEAIGRAKEIVP